MLKSLKQVNRALRNKIKAWKLAHYTAKYDQDPSHGKTVCLAHVKSLAILRWDDKLGDAIMCGVFIQALKCHRPDITVTIIAPSSCANWLNKATECRILACDKRGRSTAKKFKQYTKQFDVVMDLGTSFDFKELLALHNLAAPINIGYNKHEHPIFNVHIPVTALHFKDRYLAAAQLFCSNVDLSNVRIPTVPFDSQTPLSSINSEHTKIAVNLFGSSKYRQFSEAESIKLIRHWLNDFPQDHLYLIPVPSKIDMLKGLVRHFNDERLILMSETPSLELTLSLLHQVDMCFSPDTSVVHMASALNTPILAIYADDPSNFNEWKPLSSCSQVIFNPKAENRNDRVYVHDFEWQDFKEKRLALLR